MAKTLTCRTVLELVNDSGEPPEKALDTAGIDRYALLLSGFTDITPGRRIRLAAAAADQALTFTSAIAILIVSHDYPFSLRLAAGQTLLANLRQFLVFCDDTADAAAVTSVLLTGNGDNVADLEVWIVEKP